MRAALIRRALTALAAAKLFDLLVEGALTLDTGLGRRVQPLGPCSWQIAAPRELVFELIEGPYRRTPRALREKLEVWERGGDMVLAAHMTQVGRRKVTTVETVRFGPPERIHFRLVRGPVPHVAERFELEDSGSGETTLTWVGELGTDFGPLGEWFGACVARSWQRTVETSMGAVRPRASVALGPGRPSASSSSRRSPRSASPGARKSYDAAMPSIPGGRSCTEPSAASEPSLSTQNSSTVPVDPVSA